MSDAFGVESHTRVSRRATKSTEAARFSPSFGVHHGLIPDPNWPPAQFPDNSVAMQRRDRRVVCDLTVDIDGRREVVRGDLSKGGAMFLLAGRSVSNVAVVEVRGVRAEVSIVAVSTRGASVAHHAHFTDAKQGLQLWLALISA